jgi:RHS repeat-associated protein
MGGYAYSAFGKLLTADEPGGTAGPQLDGNPYTTQPFQWQGRPTVSNNLYDFRARIWSTELGTFLQPDQYGYLSRGGTLWSWPGNNPFRWRDPSGRGPVGRLVGTLVGGFIGSQIGALAGAGVGGGATVEFGPAVVVGVSGGAFIGGVTGIVGGGLVGGDVGDRTEEALWDWLLSSPGGPAGPRGGRGRFKSGKDTANQLEEIEEAQRIKRKQGRGGEIESTKKSKDRLRHKLNQICDEADSEAEFGNGDDELER